MLLGAGWCHRPGRPRGRSGAQTCDLVLLGRGDELGEHRPQGLTVAAVRGAGGVDVLLRVECSPVDAVAGVLGELLDERALGAAVAFAEGWVALISAR
jgi:hypothetical protein